MTYERMLDKEHQPSENDIFAKISETSAWNHFRDYLASHYDHESGLIYYGKKYGWTIRYRKSGKTLCSLFPESGAFSVLVTLGKKEVARVFAEIDDFSSGVRHVIENTSQLHDGIWLWIRVFTQRDVDDIKKLLAAKHKPKIKRGQ